MNETILEISAFFIALFCCVDCLKNRTRLYLPFPKGWLNKVKDQHFVFLLLQLTVMISAISSVLEVSMENYAANKSVFVLALLNEIYFFFHTALPFLFTLYIMNMTGILKNKGKLFFALFVIPMAIVDLLILSNPLTGLIFYIDESISYCRGSLLWLLYIIGVIYVLIGIVFFVIKKELIPKLDRSSTIILIAIATLGIAVQAIFAITVELFFESIAFLGFMILLEDRKYREKTGENGRMSNSFISIVVLIFITVISMNVNLIYHAGTDQTEKIGESQINNLSGEMQQALSESESGILRFSMGLDELIDDSASLKEIEKYIYEQQDQYVSSTDGNCFSVYAASPDWTIIPGFVFPEEYHAMERVWYLGAKKNPGQVYISEPYVDADTGDLCYTFSYMLSDGKTVAAMDYTLSRVQDIVGRMGGNDDQFAMIVTDDGMIVGCSEIYYQGEELLKSLPQYAEVFERVKASNEHKGFITKIDRNNRIIFSGETSNGWKLILIENYSTFYADIINQLILLGAIDILMVAVVVVFYLISIKNQERAENALISTESFIASVAEELREPLNDILRADEEFIRESEPGDASYKIDYSAKILKEKMDNLFAYSDILKSGAAKEVEIKKKNRNISAYARNVRNGITTILIVATLIGLFLCVGVTTRWGASRMSKEADKYDAEVTLWMEKNLSIIDMFSNVIATDPSILDDYDHAVEWLDDIAGNYDEITFAYMANPYNIEHPIIMNNGWVPDDDYKVEERQWYIDTERSGRGYSISAPYFDAQTGLYCITFSKSVYSKEGEFLGVFAIDCLMDKLIDVLDDSYASDSYAFMVDQDGIIINHPNKAYQISEERSINIEDTEYQDVYHKGSVFRMYDHDGRSVACIAEKSSVSGFSVIVVQSWWSIYGAVLMLTALFLIMLLISMIGVSRMLTRFTVWQEEANEKLVIAAEKAEASEKAKSRFLAQMSHEIRTPINAVLGMNEMILRESSDENIRDYSGSIKSAGKNLLGIINTILDFSKIEEGKMEIIPVKYDTASMIENMITSISKRASDKGLEFEAHVDESLPSVLYGDDMRVSQVAINLLTNAVKYTKEGRVDLYVDGRKTDDDSLSLKIRVKDTGSGIKEEDIDKLFESFTRLEERKNRNIEGTGLGMSIVNRLLDMMGSRLQVSSTYGQGSEFAFEVEQGIVDDAPIGDYEAKAKEVLKKKEDRYLYAPDAKLLVVDDNGVNLKVVKHLLKRNGVVPETVQSGAEAIEKLKENKYHILMLDHMMPEMDGIETLKKAREEDVIDKDCTVIALTANAVVGAREQYIEAGFDDYLSKPIEVPALESLLEKYLPKEIVSFKNRADDEAKA